MDLDQLDNLTTRLSDICNSLKSIDDTLQHKDNPIHEISRNLKRIADSLESDK